MYKTETVFPIYKNYFNRNLHFIVELKRIKISSFNFYFNIVTKYVYYI